MDFPATPTPPHPLPWARAAPWTAWFALALYATLLGLHVGAVAGGSDSSGYMNHARLLAERRVHVQPRVLAGLPQSSAPAFLYVPLGFKPAWNGDGLVPTYPTGFALFVLALEPLVGWRYAGDVTIILHSLAGLVATYALGRVMGLGRAWAVVGASMIALSPLYLFMSLQAMSDVPSLVWTTLALLAALRSRQRSGWALAAGAAMAADVLLRPTNVLALLPMAFVLGFSPRRWTLFVAGGMPGAVFFAAHSVAAYGSFATTGYGDSSYAFNLGYIPRTLLHYGKWLPALFTPLVACFFGLPWIRSERAGFRGLIGIWVLVYALFFSAYMCTHETWWYLRFLLPAAPALVVGSLLVARALLARAPKWTDPVRSPTALAAVLALIFASSGLFVKVLNPLSVGKEELRYQTLSDWVRRNLPPDSVCLTMQASGTLFYYTHLTFLRWDALDRQTVGKVEAAVRTSKRPLYAVLFPFEISNSDVLGKRMPGHWSEVGNVEGVTIWRRDFDLARTGP